MTPKIKLTYFDTFGRAGPIRLALAAGRIEFEDVRLSKEEFAAQKKAGAFPFGSVPVMEINGEVLAETAALMRYAGKLSGLYPENPLDAAEVDMVMDGLENLLKLAKEDSSPEGRDNFVKEVLPRYMKPLNDMVARHKGGPFVLGEEMSIADLWLIPYVGYFTTGKLEHIPKDCLNCYSHVLTAAKATGKNEKVSAWWKEHEKF